MLWTAKTNALLTARKLQVQRQIDDIIKSKKRNRPKKRKKDAEEDVLDRFADEEVIQLREDMLRAAAEDDEANKDKLPGTAKLKLLPRVREVLQRYALVFSVISSMFSPSYSQSINDAIYHRQQLI